MRNKASGGDTHPVLLVTLGEKLVLYPMHCVFYYHFPNDATAADRL